MQRQWQIHQQGVAPHVGYTVVHLWKDRIVRREVGEEGEGKGRTWM